MDHLRVASNQWSLQTPNHKVNFYLISNKFILGMYG